MNTLYVRRINGRPRSEVEPEPVFGLESDGTLAGDDASIITAARRLLALHERGAASAQILAACQDLRSAAERELLRRETRMMSVGEPDLAAHVRHHGDILLKLEDEVRELRRESNGLSPRFLRFLHSLLKAELRPVMNSSTPKALCPA